MSHAPSGQSDDDMYEDDDDSDDEYNMELYGMRQALPIPEGEPDWELEEPDTVEEYLRRVRWEAARVPKVVTAAIDATTFEGQQTSYIPKLEALPEPPSWAQIDHTWVQQFVHQFQQLRLYLAGMAEATVNTAPALPHPNDLQAWDRLCFGRDTAATTDTSTTAGNINDAGGAGAGSAGAAEGAVGGMEASSSADGAVDGTGDTAAGTREVMEEEAVEEEEEEEEEFAVPGPVMRILQQLDQVAVVSLLLRHIDQLAAGAALSLLRSQWLFALAARLDKPLHAETAAALRQLLRHCCMLRAALKRYDDPALPLLNILIAITGAYFGQDEALTRVAAQDLL